MPFFSDQETYLKEYLEQEATVDAMISMARHLCKKPREFQQAFRKGEKRRTRDSSTQSFNKEYHEKIAPLRGLILVAHIAAERAEQNPANTDTTLILAIQRALTLEGASPELAKAITIVYAATFFLEENDAIPNALHLEKAAQWLAGSEAWLNHHSSQILSLHLLQDLMNGKAKSKAIRETEALRQDLLLGKPIKDEDEDENLFAEDCLIAITAIQDLAAVSYFSHSAGAFRIERTSVDDGFYEATLKALQQCLAQDTRVQGWSVEAFSRFVRDSLHKPVIPNTTNQNPKPNREIELTLIAEHFKVQIQKHNHLNDVTSINPTQKVIAHLFFSVTEQRFHSLLKTDLHAEFQEPFEAYIHRALPSIHEIKVLDTCVATAAAVLALQPSLVWKPSQAINEEQFIKVLEFSKNLTTEESLRALRERSELIIKSVENQHQTQLRNYGETIIKEVEKKHLKMLRDFAQARINQYRDVAKEVVRQQREAIEREFKLTQDKIQSYRASIYQTHQEQLQSINNHYDTVIQNTVASFYAHEAAMEDARRHAKNKRKRQIVRSIVAVAITAFVVPPFAAGLFATAPPVFATIGEGVLSGALNSAITKGNILKDAFQGGVFAGFGMAVSGVLDKVEALNDLVELKETIKMAIVASTQTLVNGGNFGQALIIGGLSNAAANFTVLFNRASSTIQGGSSNSNFQFTLSPQAASLRSFVRGGTASLMTGAHFGESLIAGGIAGIQGLAQSLGEQGGKKLSLLVEAKKQEMQSFNNQRSLLNDASKPASTLAPSRTMQSNGPNFIKRNIAITAKSRRSETFTLLQETAKKHEGSGLERNNGGKEGGNFLIMRNPKITPEGRIELQNSLKQAGLNISVDEFLSNQAMYSHKGKIPKGSLLTKIPLSNDDLQNFSNIMGGAGDAMSFGLGSLARRLARIENVDTASKAYLLGEIGSTVVSIGPGLLRSGVNVGKIGLTWLFNRQLVSIAPNVSKSSSSLLKLFENYKIGKSDKFKDVTIFSSSPSEIYHGYGELSKRQMLVLEKLSKPNTLLKVNKSDLNVRDLAALTAKTGDEFAMFTLGNRRLILRGNQEGIRIKNILPKLQSQGWRWSAHTHPGTKDILLNASGFPGDRQVLELLNQERSLILNSTGRKNVFDMKHDIHLTSEVVKKSISSNRPNTI